VGSLRNELSVSWTNIQASLFPHLEEELGPLSEKEMKLIEILEFIRIEDHVTTKRHRGWRGRPLSERTAIARSFVAKMVYNAPTTRAFLDRLRSDASLRRLCGWEMRHQIPSESTFSRAYAEFSRDKLPERVHASVVKNSYRNEIIGHISRDSTAIDAREKPAVKEKAVKAAPQKRGRPKKGEERPKKKTRLEKQINDMTVEEMLEDLPNQCDVGTKRNSKGHQSSWIGYKLHIDAADGGVPISCVITSASVHDSQVAIPLAEITRQRADSLYDLMDAAYDSPLIHASSSFQVESSKIPRENTPPFGGVIRWTQVCLFCGAAYRPHPARGDARVCGTGRLAALFCGER